MSRVILFGSFFPNIHYESRTTNSLAYLLDQNIQLSNIVILGNRNSQLTNSFSKKVSLKNVWEPDDIVSLIKILLYVTLSGCDNFVFNISLTSFGTKKLTNFLGLLLPPLTSLIKRRRAIVYMHSFLESQNIEQLGYKAGRLERSIVRFLEKLNAMTSTLITFLPSISVEMTRILKKKVHYQFIPFRTAIFLHEMTSDRLPRSIKERKRPNVLLFGVWGPKKDLIGILTSLKEMLDRKEIDIHVTVAGAINRNFPRHEVNIMKLMDNLDSENFSFIWNPEDLQIPELFVNADCVVLPYRASVGSSGVLHLSAFYGCKTVAYYNERIAEEAMLLNADITFVNSPMDEQFLDYMKNVKVREPPNISELQRKVLKAVKEAATFNTYT